jgi:hypothetical protein
MWPLRYFTKRYWAGRFFPPTGSSGAAPHLETYAVGTYVPSAEITGVYGVALQGSLPLSAILIGTFGARHAQGASSHAYAIGTYKPAELLGGSV